MNNFQKMIKFSVFNSILNSQAPETTWVPSARCARSGTNGQAVVGSLQNFHETQDDLDESQNLKIRDHHKVYNFSKKML